MLTPRYHIATEYYRHNKSAVAKKAEAVAEVPDVTVSKDEIKQPAKAVVEIADDSDGSSGDSSQCSSSSNSSET